jgi:hypothetical protein
MLTNTYTSLGKKELKLGHMKLTNKNEGIPSCVEILQKAEPVVVYEVNIPLSSCLTKQVSIEKVVQVNIQDNVVCWQGVHKLCKVASDALTHYDIGRGSVLPYHTVSPFVVIVQYIEGHHRFARLIQKLNSE